MKKILLAALLLLMAGSAYAALSETAVSCDIQGKTKSVASIKACKDSGGKVMEVKKITRR